MKPLKKLALHKETLRDLDHAESGEVQGGAIQLTVSRLRPCTWETRISCDIACNLSAYSLCRTCVVCRY
jgi:hypothetical protein